MNLELKGQEVLISQTTSSEFLPSILNKLDDTFNFDKLMDILPHFKHKDFWKIWFTMHHTNTDLGFSAMLFS